MYRNNIDLNSANCHFGNLSMSEEDAVKTEILTRVQGSLESSNNKYVICDNHANAERYQYTDVSS